MVDLLGARFRPLENSPRYGPKTWKQDSDGVWVEFEMTKEARDFARLESTLLWANPHSAWCRTEPITEADAEKEPGLKSYVDGFAMFPKVEGFDVSTKEGAARAAKQELAWQEKALRMHENQQPIRIADKPEDGGSTGNYFRELKRGD